jgi:hypothetical protein
MGAGFAEGALTGLLPRSRIRLIRTRPTGRLTPLFASLRAAAVLAPPRGRAASTCLPGQSRSVGDDDGDRRRLPGAGASRDKVVTRRAVERSGDHAAAGRQRNPDRQWSWRAATPVGPQDDQIRRVQCAGRQHGRTERQIRRPHQADWQWLPVSLDDGHPRQAAQDAGTRSHVGELDITVGAAVVALPPCPDLQHRARARHRLGCRPARSARMLSGAGQPRRCRAASEHQGRAPRQRGPPRNAGPGWAWAASRGSATRGAQGSRQA